MGKKNIGKTYQMFQLIRQAIAEGRWVVVVRSTVKECITALQPFFEEEASPVRVKQRANNTYDLIIKDSDWTYGEDGHKKRTEPTKVGFCCSISSLTSYQGASYEKVKYIIWDECIDDGSLMSGRVTQASLNVFERFNSSVVRDKLDVRTILFGNLLEKASGMAGDPVLEHFGIDVKCGCKYIPATAQHAATVLYINTKDMFKGIDQQGVIGGINSLITSSLLTNDLKPKGIKNITYAQYLEAKPYRVLVFTYEKRKVAIMINAYSLADEQYLAVNIGMLNEKHIHAPAYTHEAPLYNNFSHAISWVEEDVWVELLEELYEYCTGGRVFCVGEHVADELNVYMKHFEAVIEQAKKKNV